MKCGACERPAQMPSNGLCRRCYGRQWRAAHPTANREYVAKHRRLPGRWRKSVVRSTQQAKARRYAGWAPGEHEKAEAALKVVTACACCGSLTPRRANGWCGDHDHRTGKFRGMLCHPCNIRIGFAEKYNLEFSPQEERYIHGQSEDP